MIHFTSRVLPVFLAVCCPIAHADPPKSPRPHIVLFVSDDMGWNDVGFHGSKAETPHLDRMVKEGVELERFYVYPICSPTRIALMTGRSPIRFGILRPIGGSAGVPLEEHFMPKAFQTAGYQTFMVGKWHLGAAGDEYGPRKRGFDHFYGFRGGVIDYYSHQQGGRLDWQRNGKALEEEGYATDLFAAEAVRLLKNRDKEKPVFLYLPFNAPHGPPQAPEEQTAKYETLGIAGRAAVRAASIDSMDQAIGKVLAILEEEGMSKDTLVMFFCDNGAPGSRQRPQGAGGRPGRARGGEVEEGLGNNPLRGGKGSVNEGGIRVPAVMRWPEVIAAGSKSQQLFSVLDLLPTLSAAAGIEHGNDQPMDGVNVWPAIRDGKVVSRKPVVIASQASRAVLKDQWKLIEGSGKELYNVVKDPTESKDLAGDHPEVVTKLSAGAAPFAKLMAAHPGEERRRGGRRGRRPARGDGAEGGRPPRPGGGPEGQRPPRRQAPAPEGERPEGR